LFEICNEFYLSIGKENRNQNQRFLTADRRRMNGCRLPPLPHTKNDVILPEMAYLQGTSHEIENIQSQEPVAGQVIDPEFRRDLAFPLLSDETVERLRSYGREDTVPEKTVLYRRGDRNTDMFVVLEGGIDVLLPSLDGTLFTFAHHAQNHFSGEFSLLNSQGAVIEARTTTRSRLLRISRKDFRLMMRAEGDIANVIVSACIWRRIGVNACATGGIVVRGHAGDAALMYLQRFFVRNYYPHRIEEIPWSADAEGKEIPSALPAVVLPSGSVLVRPTIAKLADELGITETPDPQTVYDVAVVGAGPSGLAAAVYAASEGLSTIVVESTAPGGQAGTSSKIENYLGFPTGVSGAQLASRGHLQALKFGVHFAISREVVSTQTIDGMHQLLMAGGNFIRSRSIVVASGAQYRSLSVKNHRDYENRGLYYAATAMESVLCREREVIVVGGGNSAGQAALFLADTARHVHHIVRGPSLSSTMSQYLISRIERSPRITLYTNSEIETLEGEAALKSVTWADRNTGEKVTRPVTSVFVMIGAEPNSGWLFGTVRLDPKGFVLTGDGAGFENSPYATNVPGMYAVGDVRANSVKRVASAVGEGSVVISDIHRYLAKLS
jgi:thioredoxin reductase (NADPH)